MLKTTEIITPAKIYRAIISPQSLISGASSGNTPSRISSSDAAELHPMKFRTAPPTAGRSTPPLRIIRRPSPTAPRKGASTTSCPECQAFSGSPLRAMNFIANAPPKPSRPESKHSTCTKKASIKNVAKLSRDAHHDEKLKKCWKS